MNDLHNSVNLSFLNETNPSKSQKTRLNIIYGAIEAYAEYGLEKTTYVQISKKAGVSRTLIIHYYPKQEELFNNMIMLVRHNMQLFAIKEMGKAKSLKIILKRYVNSTFLWVDQFPSHAKVWLLYYSSCASNPKTRSLNTELVNQGQKRIQSMLHMFENEKDVQFADSFIVARQIQVLITGALVAIVSEDISNKAKFKKGIIDLCLGLVIKN